MGRMRALVAWKDGWLAGELDEWVDVWAACTQAPPTSHLCMHTMGPERRTRSG